MTEDGITEKLHFQKWGIGAVDPNLCFGVGFVFNSFMNW